MPLQLDVGLHNLERDIQWGHAAAGTTRVDLGGAFARFPSEMSGNGHLTYQRPVLEGSDDKRAFVGRIGAALELNRGLHCMGRTVAQELDHIHSHNVCDLESDVAATHWHRVKAFEIGPVR